MQQIFHRLNRLGSGNNRHGFILALSMVMILLLILMASTTMMVTRTGLKVGGNFARTMDAYFVATTGLARGHQVLRSYSVLKGNLDFDDVLSRAHSSNDYLFSNGDSGTALSNVAYGSGTYTLYVVNDPQDAGGTTNDTNRKVVLKSAANLNNRTIVTLETYQEVIVPGTYAMPNTPGAMGMCGRYANMTMLASSASGYDHTPPASFNCGVACTGTKDPDPAHAYPPVRKGMATETTVTTGSTLEGNPDTIVTDTNGGCAEWLNVANTLTGLTNVDVLGTGVYSGDLGTRTNPRVTLASGVVTLDGSVDGAGVMIITDSTTILSTGNFHYEGVILILGNNAALNIVGNAHIFGAVVITASALDAQQEFTGAAGTHLYYSSAALGTTAVEAIESASGEGDLQQVSWSENY